MSRREKKDIPDKLKRKIKEIQRKRNDIIIPSFWEVSPNEEAEEEYKPENCVVCGEKLIPYKENVFKIPPEDIPIGPASRRFTRRVVKFLYCPKCRLVYMPKE